MGCVASCNGARLKQQIWDLNFQKAIYLSFMLKDLMMPSLIKNVKKLHIGIY